MKIPERIDKMGFGLYQMHVFILSAGFIVAEGSELQMAAGLANAIIDEFHIVSHVGRSMLMTMAFIGFAVGTITSGPVGDIYGRRAPMFVGYLGVVCTAVVTYFAPSEMWIYCLRFCLGFFGGIGIPTALITISEVSPRKWRGMSTAALGVAYCLGDLWAALGLWLVLPDLQQGPWRLLLFWAAAPATSLLFFGLVSPVSRYDTPFFLAAKNRNREVKACLRMIGELNGQPEDSHLFTPPTTPPKTPPRSPRGGQDTPKEAATDMAEADKPSKASSFYMSAVEMLEWPTSLYTISLCLMFFAKDFGYYGMGVFWPLTWAQLDIGELLPAQDLFLTAVLGIPGVGLAMAMVYKMNRRPAIAVSGVVCAFATVLIWYLERGHSIGLLGVVFFKLFFPTWQMVTMLLPCEVFPTQIRSFAYGIVAMMGRIATIVSPSVVEKSHTFFLFFTAALGILSAVAAMALPETKDCKLVDRKLDRKMSFGAKLQDYGSTAEHGPSKQP